MKKKKEVEEVKAPNNSIRCEYSELVELHKLVPHPRNANKHGERQIELLAKIIDHQGQRHPVVVSKRSGFICAGHGRVLAMIKLGWTECAVDFQDFKDEAQEFAFLIADNKIAELAEHDDLKMIQGMEELKVADFELLGMDTFVMPHIPSEMEDELREDMNKKFILEITFPNEMELADIRDDLTSRGYIVKEK